MYKSNGYKDNNSTFCQVDATVNHPPSMIKITYSSLTHRLRSSGRAVSSSNWRDCKSDCNPPICWTKPCAETYVGNAPWESIYYIKSVCKTVHFKVLKIAWFDASIRVPEFTWMNA